MAACKNYLQVQLKSSGGRSVKTASRRFIPSGLQEPALEAGPYVNTIRSFFALASERITINQHQSESITLVGARLSQIQRRQERQRIFTGAANGFVDVMLGRDFGI